MFELGIDIEDLIFLDYRTKVWHYYFSKKINLKFLKTILKNAESNDLLWMSLVDHNELTSKYDFLEKNIKNNILHVIDHHKISNQNNIDPKILLDVRTIGSAVTIISEIIFKKFYDIIDEKILILLISTMMIDQGFKFDKPNYVTTENDIIVFNYILDEMKKYNNNFSLESYRSYYYDKLINAKNNIEGLTSKQILKKDYKQWKNKIRYGISSVLLSIKDFESRDEYYLNKVIDLYTKNNLDLIIIHHTYKNESGEKLRELILMSIDELLINCLFEYMNDNIIIKNTCHDCRNIIKVHSKDYIINKDITEKDSNFKIFYKLNLDIKSSVSRKILQPVINSFLENNYSL